MSNENKDAEASNDTVKAEEAKTESRFANTSRNDIYKKYNEQQLKLSDVSPVEDTTAADADLKESESEGSAAQNRSDSSSSVKEDVTKVKQDKPKGDPIKALHEEREKRKEANRRFRDLQTKFDVEIKQLQDQIAAIKLPKTEKSEFGADDAERSSDPVKQELEKLRHERSLNEQQKRQDEVRKQQETLRAKIDKTTKELKEEGYPGFQYALTRVDAAITKRVDEGDLLPEDASKPDIWKQVYMEEVYGEVAAEFKQTQKAETIEKKLLAKQKAKLSANAGQSPDGLAEDKEEVVPTQDEIARKYISDRNKKSPNR